MRYESKDLALAAAFGWLCGMRSMSGPAIVGRKLLKSEPLANMLAVGAAGEMLIDKHPSTPNRNAPPPLAARTMTGAITGAAIVVSGAGWARKSRLRTRHASWPMSDDDVLAAAAVGAVIGGSFAFVSTHVTYHWRRLVGERTKAPNAALGAAEDILVYTAGVALSQNLD